MLLNLSVYALIKVQDLVDLFLHESLGGDLVDAGTTDWGETQLKRKNVKKGLGGFSKVYALRSTRGRS